MSATSSLVRYSGASTECHESREVSVAGPMPNEARNGNEDRGVGGVRLASRWSPKETVALLKIRSDMDITFREFNLKSPLWEAISRKLAEIGYNRSAKKCKEKFENMYKYHKRTKERRSAKHDGKIYRFSKQLEALESHLFLPPLSSEKLQTPKMVTTVLSVTAIESTYISQISTRPSAVHHINTCDFISTSNSSQPSLGAKSDNKKRKWSTFFESLSEKVVKRQEIFESNLLKKLEELEHGCMAREETWKMQEMEKANREHEILVQEGLVAAAARNATLVSFLEKISEQPNILQLKESSLAMEKMVSIPALDNCQSFIDKSSSRWTKDEVQALITIRSNFERKYPTNIHNNRYLWEEISAVMNKLGCNRSAKKCKEKWENMNKYFKKVRESNKKRAEDSKTCPYFHQLEALYKEKMDKVNNPSDSLNAEELLMHMMMSGSKQQTQSLEQDQLALYLATN